LRWAVLIVLAAVLVLAALMTVSVRVAAVFWDGPRGWVLGSLLAYLASAAALLLAVQRWVQRSPPC
jgi:hypothetical protein